MSGEGYETMAGFLSGTAHAVAFIVTVNIAFWDGPRRWQKENNFRFGKAY